MGMVFVVMFEDDGQVADSCAGIRLGHKVHVIALHCLHKALGHPIALRTAHRSVDRLQTHITSEAAG